MKKLICLLVVVFCLPIVFAATCGDGNAQGNEECDGSDLREYTCYRMDHLDPDDPSDYDEDSPSYYTDGYIYYGHGTLACGSDCMFDISACYNIVCGDGEIRGLEECDDGADNSDSQADACRTDCEMARCGDGVLDSGEQCDDGYDDNSDEIPGACRTDCSSPTCGDGVIDVWEGEECDDPNDNNCFRCRRCVEPRDDLVLNEDTLLCDGTYVINDEDNDGVIQVAGEGITVRCLFSSTTIIGVTKEFQIMSQQELAGGAQQQNIAQNQVQNQQQGNSAPAQQQLVNTQGPGQSQQQSGGFFAGIVRFVASVFGGGEDTTPNVPTGGAISEIRHGTGFLITGDHATVIGCEAENYRTGFDMQAEGALIRNTACDNNRDMLGEGVGMGNTCDSHDWYDVGFDKCAYTCSGADGEEIVGCPTCPEAEECECEECSTTETEPEEVPDEEPELIECDDGSFVEDEDDCPKPEWKCKDGSIVHSYKDCPSCPKGETMCDDGSCERSAWKCDPYICWDDSEVRERDDCPCKEGVKCDDGSCEDEGWMCDPYKCDDGSLVADESDCPVVCPHTCGSGECVDEPADCQECCKTPGPTVTHVTWEYNFVDEGKCSGTVVSDDMC